MSQVGELRLRKSTELGRDPQVASSIVRIRTQANVTTKSLYQSEFLILFSIFPGIVLDEM